MLSAGSNANVQYITLYFTDSPPGSNADPQRYSIGQGESHKDVGVLCVSGQPVGLDVRHGTSPMGVPVTVSCVLENYQGCALSGQVTLNVTS